MGDDNKVSDFIIDSRSSYFLHPSDPPGALITATCFDGKNFDLWEKAVITAWTPNNKVAFIDGTITKSDMKKEGNPAQMNA